MTNLLGMLSGKGVVRRLGILALLGAAIHVILPQITTLQNSWQALLKMSLWAVGLAFAAQVLSYLGNGNLLQRTLSITQVAVSLTRSTLIVLGSASIAMLAGGTLGSSAAIYQWTSTDQGSIEGATLASLLLPLANNVLLVCLSIFGLAHLILVHNLTQAQVIGFSAMLITLVITIGLGLLAARYRGRAVAVVIWFTSHAARLLRKPYTPIATQKYMDQLFSAWDLIWQGQWQTLLPGALLNVVFDILTLYFLFVAAGYKISPGVLLSGYALPLLMGKMAFFIPGGVGVVESSMAALYTGMGVPHAITVVVVLVYRLLSFWLPSLIGFPVAAYLQGTRKRNHPEQVTGLQ